MGPVASVTGATAGFHEIPGIEDVASVLLRFANGATGTLMSVWHDVLERPSLRRVELFCERAYAVLEGDWFGPVEWVTTGSAPARLDGDALEEEARRRGMALGNPDVLFVDAIIRREQAWPSFADALRAHTLADAVYRSAAAGGAPISV
jgi:predicted dehydrogenase